MDNPSEVSALLVGGGAASPSTTSENVAYTSTERQNGGRPQHINMPMEVASSTMSMSSSCLSETSSSSSSSYSSVDNKVGKESTWVEWKEHIYDELMEQLQTAIPTLQCMVLYKIPWLISLRFVGSLGSEELASAALATTICNVTGMSLSVGLSSALTTLTSQAKGELLSKSKRKNSNLKNSSKSCQILYGTSQNDHSRQDEGDVTGVDNEEEERQQQSPITTLIYLYRGLVIQMLIVVPVGIWWLYGIKDFLLYMGQSDQIATMTEGYLRLLTPGLWCYSISMTFTSWVQAMNMADVPVYASIVGLTLHVPFNYFFIHVVGMGYLGCAVATVIYQTIQPLLVMYYLFVYPKGKQRVLLVSLTGSATTTATTTTTDAAGAAVPKSSNIGDDNIQISFWKEFIIAISSIQGVMQYLSLALPGIVIISEWWASEISIFLSGNLHPSPEAALGGMTIYQSINTFCFMFPVAFAVSGSARVGSLLGSGDPDGAKFAAQISVACAALVSATLGCILFFVPHTFFPALFAPDEPEVILETSRTIPLLSTYVFADGVQTALNGIIKGCGRQCIIMPIVLIAYWVGGVPLAYYLAFIRNDGDMSCSDSRFCGDVALVAGMTTGTWIHMLLLALVVVCTTHWKEESKKARERVVHK